LRGRAPNSVTTTTTRNCSSDYFCGSGGTT
jgi:hypothetical protein